MDQSIYMFGNIMVSVKATEIYALFADVANVTVNFAPSIGDYFLLICQVLE